MAQEARQAAVTAPRQSQGPPPLEAAAQEAQAARTSVEIGGKLGAHWVRVGGHMLACTRLTLDMDAVSVPELRFSLPVYDGAVVTLDSAIMSPSDETRAALIAMGWTPPEES